MVSGSSAVGRGVEVEDEAVRSLSCWLRRAAMRTLTYSVTWPRISRPGKYGRQLNVI